MHISCEKCGTTYVLDERLIPATGAPVQCTRCQHVFTAMPPQAEKAAGAPASQTMMFGAPGSTGPVPDNPSTRPTSSTQMFGAIAPQSPNPAGGSKPASSTQMFGAVNSGPTPKESAAPRSTQVFGALSPQAPNAAGSSKPASSSTQMFGAMPPDASKGPTNIDFGKQPPPSGAGRSTMIFGASGSAPKPSKSDATVRVGPADLERMLKEHREGRGGEVTPSEGVPAQPDRHNATQLFAMANADSTPSESAPPQDARRDKTQLFAYADGAEKPPEEPQRRDKTQLFAYSDAPLPPEPPTNPAHHNKTQMFALSDVAPAAPQKPQTDEPARHNKTQLFAYGDGEPLAPVTEPLQPVEVSKPKALDRQSGVGKYNPSAPKATMIFGGAADGKSAPPIEHEPVHRELATDPAGADVRDLSLKESHNVTFPNLPDVDPNAIDLQPSTLSGDESVPPLAAPTEPPGELDDVSAAIAASGRRRTVIALVVVGLLVLALLAAAGYKLFGDRLFASKVDAQALASLDSELLRLKADDSASKSAAIKGLSSLVASHPDYVEGHAALVTAYVLQLDDLQQQASRLEKASVERNNRVEKYNREKQPADWVSKATALTEEVQKLNEQLTKLLSDEKNVDGRLRSAYKQFGDAAQKAGHATVEAQRAALRAQALYQAYGGSDRSLAMLNDFRKLGANDGDGWIELVSAEYAVNAPKATEGMYADALKQLETLRKHDGSFTRTYTLAGRIHLQKGEFDAAESEIDKLLAIAPKHDIGLQLKEAIRVTRSEKAARDHELKEIKEKAEKEAATPP